MLSFSAYYPATTGTSMTAFTLPADQSSVEKIALADYMTRQQVISRPEGGSDIQMQLERKMARVIVNIAGFGSQYRDDQKTVSNVRIYSEASGIADGNPTGSSTEIQPYAQGSNDGWGWSQNSTFTALVVPGYGDSGADFIQLSDGEGSTLRVKGIPELEAGNSYTFNLTVGKNRILVQSVTVQDWTTGETLAGGQAQRYRPDRDMEQRQHRRCHRQRHDGRSDRRSQGYGQHHRHRQRRQRSIGHLCSQSLYTGCCLRRRSRHQGQLQVARW